LVLSSSFNNKSSIKVRWTANVSASQTIRIDDIVITATSSGNTVPILSIPTSSSVSNSSAILGATISNNGGVSITESGIVYDTSANPTGNATATNPLVSSNSAYTINVSSLSPQTLYYYRGYAINTVGTGYSSDGTFRTLSNPPTLQASGLSGTATSQTNIDLTWTATTFPESGATAKGYVLLRAISPNTPSLSNGNGAAPSAETNTTIVSSSILSSATSASSSSLSANTTYNYLLVPYTWDGSNTATYNYLTASAPTTSATTLPNVPTISATTAISSISNSGASSGGTTLSASGGTITAKGIVWNTTTSPVLPGLGNTNDGSGTANYSSILSGLSPQTLYYVRAYANNEGGTGYGTNLSFRTLSNPPTSQANDLLATSTSSQIDLTWVSATFPESGATTKRYVLLRATSPNTPSLSNGNGAAPAAGANTTIVSSTIDGTATSASSSSLSANTIYNYLLVPYTWDGTNAATYNYLTTSAPTVSKTTLAIVPSAPTVNTPSVNSLNVSITLGSNPSVTEFAIYETTTSQFVQANGSLGATAVWQNNSTWGTKTVTGLNSSTTYTFQVKARNIDLVETAYSTSNSGTTYATEPTTQATNLIFSEVGSTTMNVTFTAGEDSPNGYIVLRRAGSAPSGSPIDGTTYTLGQSNIGSGTNTVAYIGASTNFSESGLTAGTNYFYSVFSYNTNGSSPNYYTTSPLTGNQLLICAAPTANAATAITTSSLTANWTTTTGAASYRIDLATDNGFNNYVSGYENLNVGNVTTYNITDLTIGTAYYYRVRAVNASGISVSSNVITTGTASNYYSKGNLAPESTSSWSSTPDGSGATPANFTSPSNYFVQNGHTMTTTGTWSFGASGSVLQIQNGGVLQANNAITIASGATFQIDNGGTYIHNNTGAFETTIFNGTESFSSNSTVEFRDWNTTGPIVNSWGNVIFNATGSVSGSIQMSSNMTNINGNLEIKATGSTQREIRLTSSTDLNLNIAGNLIVSGGFLNLTNGTGNTSIYLNGDLTLSGGEISESSSGSGRIIFNKSGIQLYSDGGTISNNISFEVGINSILDVNTYVLSGGGSFILSSGSTLKTANLSGLNGSLTLTGSKTLSSGANYIFSSSSTQVTGSLIPATVNNLTIDNAEGVTLSNNQLTVNGTLLINSGKKLEIGVGKQLTVSGTLTNNAGNAGLIIKSNASGTGTLIHSTSNVNATVQQYLPDTRNWYISSPVTGAIAPAGYTYYQRDEVGSSWLSKPFAADSIFIKGRGYIALPGTAASTITFSGTLNTGSIPVYLTWGGSASKGFNLIGNPYPSHLAWTPAFVNDLTNADIIEPSIYVRTNAGTANNSGQWSFQTYNASNGIAVPSHALLSGGIIPPMQAFWVRAKKTGVLILDSKLTKSHQTSNLLKAPSANNSNRQLVRLQIDNGITTDETVIYADASASDAFDRYDSPKFEEVSSVMQLYTTVESEKLVINGMNTLPLNTPIPLGVVPGNATSFTFKANEISNVPADVRLILKDNETLSETDLTDGVTNYEFNASQSSSTRFSILFRSSTGTTSVDNQLSNLKVYAKDNKMLIDNYNAGNAEVKVSVFNGVGQQLHEQYLTGNKTIINKNFTSGVYMVKVDNGAGEITKKVIVQ